MAISTIKNSLLYRESDSIASGSSFSVPMGVGLLFVVRHYPSNISLDVCAIFFVSSGVAYLICDSGQSKGVISVSVNNGNVTITNNHNIAVYGGWLRFY